MQMIKYLLACLFPLILAGQSKGPDCRKVKTGTFYFYPANSQEAYTIIRNGAVQKEINMHQSDTAFFRISWLSDCSFTLKFIKKSRNLSDEEKSVYNAHNLVIEILEVTKQYYTMKAALDSLSSRMTFTDTLWFKSR